MCTQQAREREGGTKARQEGGVTKRGGTDEEGEKKGAGLSQRETRSEKRAIILSYSASHVLEMTPKFPVAGRLPS